MQFRYCFGFTSDYLIWLLDLIAWSDCLIWLLDLIIWSDYLIWLLDLITWSDYLIWLLDLITLSDYLIWLLDLITWSDYLIRLLDLITWSDYLIGLLDLIQIKVLIITNFLWISSFPYFFTKFWQTSIPHNKVNSSHFKIILWKWRKLFVFLSFI